MGVIAQKHSGIGHSARTFSRTADTRWQDDAESDILARPSLPTGPALLAVVTFSLLLWGVILLAFMQIRHFF